MSTTRAAIRERQGGIVLSVFFILSSFLAGCSNPGSSLEAGIIEKGFSPSEQQNATWMYMADDAVVVLKSGDEGKLYFHGLVDPHIYSSVYQNSLAMIFVVDGEPVKLTTISKVHDGYFDVAADVPRNKKIRVRILTDKYYESEKDGTKRSLIAYSLVAK